MSDRITASARPTARQLVADTCKAFHPERAAGEQAIIQYRLSGEGGGDWYVTIANGHCSVTEGVSPEAGVTLSMAANDLVDLGTGRIDGMTAFVSGKIQVTGSILLAIKQQSWFAPEGKPS